MIRKNWKSIVGICLIAFAAYASSIKTWSSGETLRASDLNSNFQHLHNTMVGGHGARLVDADVNASAAIAHSKLATPALLPKAWARVTSCDCDAAAGTACTINASSRVTSVKSTGADGLCQVELAYTPVNANFLVMVTANDTLAGTGGAACSANSYATANPQFTYACLNTDGTSATGASPSDSVTFLVFDNDN